MSRRAAAVGCVVVACGVAPVAASASDTGLRQVVTRQEARVAPLAKAFGEADRALQPGADTSAASAAADALRTGLRGFKNRVTPISTDTDRVARACKRRLLDAIRGFDLGLVEYQTLLEKAAAGAPPESLRESFETVNRRIAKAARREASALELIGVQG